MKKDYWHICTDGLARGVIFKDVDDYIFGMNGVPVFSLAYQVDVLAFCLMDNHVHFVLHGTQDDCTAFITGYKKRLSRIADVRSAHICMKIIDSQEYLLQVIGYVLRNPVAAGIKVMPQFYRWGSGGVYFNCSRADRCTTVKDIGRIRMRKIMRSHYDLPENYTVTPDGMVDPENYVAVKEVERLFIHPGRLLFYLSRNTDIEMELTEGQLAKQRYPDEELHGSIRNICRDTFQRTSPENLSIENRYRLAAILRKRYGLGPKQLARLTGTDPQLLKDMLHKGKTRQ